LTESAVLASRACRSPLLFLVTSMSRPPRVFQGHSQMRTGFWRWNSKTFGWAGAPMQNYRFVASSHRSWREPRRMSKRHSASGPAANTTFALHGLGSRAFRQALASSSLREAAETVYQRPRIRESNLIIPALWRIFLSHLASCCRAGPHLTAVR